MKGDRQALSVHRYATSFGVDRGSGKEVDGCYLLDTGKEIRAKSKQVSLSRSRQTDIMTSSSRRFKYRGVEVHRHEPEYRPCEVWPVKLLYQKFHLILMNQFEKGCHPLSFGCRCMVVHDTHPGFQG